MFVPVWDENSLKSIKFQVVTVSLIAINIAIFALEVPDRHGHDLRFSRNRGRQGAAAAAHLRSSANGFRHCGRAGIFRRRAQIGSTGLGRQHPRGVFCPGGWIVGI